MKPYHEPDAQGETEHNAQIDEDTELDGQMIQQQLSAQSMEEREYHTEDQQLDQ